MIRHLLKPTVGDASILSQLEVVLIAFRKCPKKPQAPISTNFVMIASMLTVKEWNLITLEPSQERNESVLIEKERTWK